MSSLRIDGRRFESGINPFEEIVSPSPAHNRPLALFDFDKTLINTDVAYHFIRQSIRGNWLRRMAFTLLAPLLLPLFAFRPSRVIAMAVWMWLATFPLRGKSAQEVLATFAPAIWQAPIHGRLYAQGLAAVRHHRRLGHRIVILTGSPQPLVAQLIAEALPGDVQVLGSTIEPFLGGLVYRHYTVGSKKIERAKAHGLTKDNWACGYSDSDHDIPLLARCRRRFLVNPDKKTLGRVKRVLGARITTLRWSTLAPQPPQKASEA